MVTQSSEEKNCVICPGLRGRKKGTLIRPDDFVYRDSMIAVFIGSFRIPLNAAHALIVPIDHIPNLYFMPKELLTRIHVMSKYVAMAFKEAFDCEGIKIVQNNEKAAGQHALHYHLHVIPCQEAYDISPHLGEKEEVDVKVRAATARTLKKALDPLLKGVDW